MYPTPFRSFITPGARYLIVLDMPSNAEIYHDTYERGAGWKTFARLLQDGGLSANAHDRLLSQLRRADLDLQQPADISVVYAFPWFDSQQPVPLIRKRKKDIRSDDADWAGRRVDGRFVEAVRYLRQAIHAAQPQVIIPVGNLALFALTGYDSVDKWRGSSLGLLAYYDYGAACIPTYSGGMINAKWGWRIEARRDLARAKAAEFPLTPPDYSFIIRPDYSTVLSTLNMLRARTLADRLTLAIDVETRDGQIACVGIAWSATEAICIPHLCIERPEGYWSFDEELEIIRRTRELLTHPRVDCVGQNFLYDAQYFLANFKYCPNHVFDTMLGQHTAYPNLSKGLDYLSSLYSSYHRYWKDESKNWDPELGEDQLWEYNCKDAVITWEIAPRIWSVLTSQGKQGPAVFQQLMFWPVLATMLTGCPIDGRARTDITTELLEDQISTQQWIDTVVGRNLNTASRTEMLAFFYEELGQEPITKRDRKTGRVSVTLNEEALETIGEREPLLLPLTKRIGHLRSVGVLLSTFITGAGIDPDGCIRCSYNIGGTITFRFSSSANAFGRGTNLQNVTSGEELAEFPLPNLRKMFVPPAGSTMFDLDGDSADLRIVTWEADEPELKDMFARGLKPYVEIAKEFYHDPSITKYHAAYPVFKAFAHATNYLGTPSGIAGRIGMSVSDVDRMQRWYFDRFPRIKTWQEQLRTRVSDHRRIQNIYGYGLELFDRPDTRTINECAAWIPQSTVAIWINRVWMRIFEQLPWIKIHLQTHDSITGSYPTYLGDEAKRQILAVAAQEVLPFADPLVIPAGLKTSTKSWGDCG
jgi:DNA polymerase I-like protein with 3'-5' exonuclease and polymerase domains